jgi:hypothetical protein
MAENNLLADSAENDLAPLSNTTGTVIIDNKTSYSGVDIKAVMHIYDGGKLAGERQDALRADINALEIQLQILQSDQSTLQKAVSGNSFSSEQANKLNSIYRQIAIANNSIDALMDEHDRIGTTKPKISTKILGELQTISISSHREKFPVRALGATYAKSYTRGSRTIAGSMIFTVFDTNVLDQFLQAHPSDFDAHVGETSALIDQIPPFDITIAFANELGQVSRMAIYGVEFVNEGMTMSIEDMLLENVVQYIARDYDPMRAVSRRKLDESNNMSNQIIPLKASALLDEQDYQTFKEGLSPFERFKARSKPFT